MQSSGGSSRTTTRSTRRRSRRWSASTRRRTGGLARAGRGSRCGRALRRPRRTSGCSSGSRGRASRSRSNQVAIGGRNMPEVYNWQLGRKMLYPYEERHPKWQFTFVFNINRCIACQTCSMADKSTWLFSKGQEYMWWNNGETKPYGGSAQLYGGKEGALVVAGEAGDRGGAVVV